MPNVLFLDFDGVYQYKSPPSNYIVLTNTYSNKWSYNINKYDCREDAYSSFTEYCQSVEKELAEEGIDLTLYKVLMFNNFFYPFSKWISSIERLKDNGKITYGSRIVFSSKSKCPKVFLLEAEGERNTQFLYRSSYYLSYYLFQFLERREYTNLVVEKIHDILPRLCFFMRGRIILYLKFFQLIFYKVFTLKRRFGFSKTKRDSVVIFSSRGVIQSDFIKNLYTKKQENMLVLINEASYLPFKNFKLAKGLFDVFYYAEGNIKFSRLFHIFKEAKRLINIDSNIKGEFLGVDIKIRNIMPETGVYDFHMKTYADSVANSIQRLGIKKARRIVTFEMLSPFSYYVKKYSQLSVIQMQTTLMALHKNPNFVYSDKFFFYDKGTYESHCIVNYHLKEKFDFVENFKYLEVRPAKRKTVIKEMVYFSQPIYLDEEMRIVELLRDFCDMENIALKIKLHPRANKGQFQHISNIKVYDGSYSSLDIIQKSDLVVTRTSSIGLDCWYANVPVLFFVNDMFKNFLVDYIPDDYLGTIKEDVDKIWLKSNIEAITKSFYAHPIQYKIRGEANSGLMKIFDE